MSLDPIYIESDEYNAPELGGKKADWLEACELAEAHAVECNASWRSEKERLEKAAVRIDIGWWGSDRLPETYRVQIGKVFYDANIVVTESGALGDDGEESYIFAVIPCSIIRFVFKTPRRAAAGSATPRRR